MEFESHYERERERGREARFAIDRHTNTRKCIHCLAPWLRTLFRTLARQDTGGKYSHPMGTRHGQSSGKSRQWRASSGAMAAESVRVRVYFLSEAGALDSFQL